jgi:hypothetical protein
MRKFFTLIGAALLVASAAQAQRHTVHPSVNVTDTTRTYQAPKATTPPVIDGDHTDAVWNLAPWKHAFAISPIDAGSWPEGTTPADKEGAFSGADDISFKYKIIWDADRYYMLLRWTDDKIIYSDNHDGYRAGSQPSYVTVTGGATGVPAVGGGDGSGYQSFRMDQCAIWITPYTEALATGATFNRGNNSLLHNFYLGKLTSQSTQAEAVLWAPKNNTPEILPRTNPKTYLPQTHQSTVAGKYVESENAYYIEFRDTTWTNLFALVRTPIADQKDYATIAPAVGDKFLLQGELNDADGTTNRRDYTNYFTHMSLASVKSPLSNLSEALVVELVETVSGLSNPKANKSLEIYPNVTAGNTINLSTAADVQIFNLSGHIMLESKNSKVINISSLKQGVYMVKDKVGNVNKLIRQ